MAPQQPADRYQLVIDQIHAAVMRYQRSIDSVALLAVSKTRSADEIAEMAALGQKKFGENYLQEALEKITALQDKGLEWHFIGPIQSNKTKPIAENFAWVHSVDRFKIAQRLNDQRPADLPPVNICIQVNVSGEESKSGCTLAELSELAAKIATLPNIRLRGLMAIPQSASNFDEQRKPFALLHEAMVTLNNEGHNLDTLSMGMSGDLDAAIAEGATMVRIGTALFGARN
ncbi:MAG: YggS family pyridoxal phosphate-dependent enzyme [Gammaproteobacteria bacterium]|nr:YggS family pyridoxal phosphate-dependent enzyme [Gammaproteobacteria bacterium]